jgi:hypothetical protein
MSDALKPDDTRDALRKIGVVLFGIGALMIFIRKGAIPGDQWSDFPLFLVLAVPAAAFYYLGVSTTAATGGLRPWQAVSAVLGLILVPLALLQFIQLVGGSGSNLNTFWIFGLTAALAAYAGMVVGVRFGLLFAAIAAIISWSGLWDWILADGIGGHIGVYRGLLGILSILLLVVGIAIWRSDSEEGLSKFSELVTGAGISALIACGLGISAVASLIPFVNPGGTIIGTTWYWDILLLVIPVGLVAIGSAIGTRGPVYVGAVGLFLFLVIVGLDLNEGRNAEPGKLGIWPWVLLIGGGGAIAASLSSAVSLGDRPRELVRKLSG